MGELEVIKGEDQPILRTVCDEVADFDKSLARLAKDMVKTMNKANGIGIAAPQVNINARICIVTLGVETEGPKTVIALVNPEVTYHSEDESIAEEGCLSLPGVYGNVSRPRKIVLKYQNIKGEQQELKLADMDARVVQHEIDHLNGVLFIDKLSEPLKM